MMPSMRNVVQFYQGSAPARVRLALDQDPGSLHQTRPDVVVHQRGHEVRIVAAPVPAEDRTFCFLFL